MQSAQNNLFDKILQIHYNFLAIINFSFSSERSVINLGNKIKTKVKVKVTVKVKKRRR